MCIIFFMFIGSKVQDNLLFALMGMINLLEIATNVIFVNILVVFETIYTFILGV